MVQVARRVDMETVWGRIGATPAGITAFCERWEIRWLALFGSVLRDDFAPSSSDVDVLYEPCDRERQTVPDAFAAQDALSKMLRVGEADLISVHTLKWRIRSRVFAQAVTLYGEPPPDVVAARLIYHWAEDEMPKDERLYIGDMLDAAREINQFAASRTYAELLTDRMFYLSMVQLIQMIGEAARNISPQTRQKHPAIPWQQIIGIHNNLVHGYDRVNNDKVWETITDDIPALIAELEAMLPPALREEPPRG